MLVNIAVVCIQHSAILHQTFYCSLVDND